MLLSRDVLDSVPDHLARNDVLVFPVFLYRLDLVFKEIMCREIVVIAIIDNLLILFFKLVSRLIMLVEIFQGSLILETLHSRTVFGQYSL